jgi:hypothetical protein
MPYRAALLLFFLLVSQAAWPGTLEFSVADITSPSFAASGIKLTLLPHAAAELRIEEVRIAEKSWQKVVLHCGKFSLGTDKIRCVDGRFSVLPELPFTLSYDFATRKLLLQLVAEQQESWKIQADFLAHPWHLQATFKHAQIKRIAGLLPQFAPLPTQGLLDGELKVLGGKDGVGSVDAHLQLAGAAFSDASGLHAGEKIKLEFTLAATQAEQQWHAQTTLAWSGGDVFWEPFYLRGGQQLQAELLWDGKQLSVPQAELQADGIGKALLSGVWDAEQKKLTQAKLSGSQLQLARLFADYAKPFVDGDSTPSSEMSGSADVAWQYQDGATQVFNLRLHDAAYVDGKQRFSLCGVNANIPWQAKSATQANLSFSSGAVWGVPLGTTTWQMEMKGLDFAMADASLPILDGKLSLQDFHLQRERDAWRWEFSGGLTPISMPALSVALGWPEMQGSLAGMIPHVQYQDRALTMDGALLFRVFDGTVVVSSLRMHDPFGPAPQLFGNVNMQALDLGALTQAFSFGNVRGRIDVKVNGLELVNWLPVRFDASVASSPGWYRKQISQKAVQNISALGGAGAAAAIQRSAMGIFENFGYSRIILSCALRNGVCAMDGESTKDNSYYIVKGGGIPAINVMGYNHEVDWDELLNRLKRVIKGNRKAIVE